jgi:hypothetical protein
MTARTPEEEKLLQDTRKVTLECAALERAAKTETLKTVLTFLAAFAFVISFALDRYKVSEQRRHDRRVVVATEFDALLSKTLASVTQALPNTLFFRLNVQAYKEKLAELGKKAGPLSESKELAMFIAESTGFADQFLKSQPERFEFTQWATAIDAEATWASRERSFTPDFESLFSKEVAATWPQLREKSLAALRNKFSLLDSTDPKLLSDFRAAASQFQASLQRELQ